MAVNGVIHPKTRKPRAILRIAEVSLLAHGHPNTFLTHAQQLQEELVEMSASQLDRQHGALLLATAWAVHGNPRLSEQLFNQARTWARKDLPAPLEFEGWIDMHISLSQLLANSRRDAFERLHGALEIFRHSNNHEGIASVHLVLAAYFAMKGTMDDAMTHHSHALVAITSTPNGPHRAIITLRAAHQYTRFGRGQLALPLLNDLIDDYDDSSVLRTTAQIYAAYATSTLEDVPTAKHTFRVAIRKARQHHPSQLPFVLLEYGAYLRSIGELPLAVGQLWHAYDVANGAENYTTATDVLEQLASTLHQAEMYQEGYEVLQLYHQFAVRVNQQHAAQEYEQQLIHDQIQKARSAVFTDSLTGLNNRRAFDQHFQQAAEYAHVSKREFSIIFIDINLFKTVNDRFGHTIGDAALQHFSEVLQDCVREEDFIARLGGDEFAIVVHTDHAGATVVAQHIQESVANAQWFRIHPDLKMSVSIGVATNSELTPGVADLQTLLIQLADDRQAAAKELWVATQ